MIWTIIYKDPLTNKLEQIVRFGPHGYRCAIQHYEPMVGGVIVAIIAGRHDIHFNKFGNKKNYC